MKTKEQLNKELDAFLADSEKTLKAAKKLIASTEALLVKIREMNASDTAETVLESAEESIPDTDKKEPAEAEEKETEHKEKTYSFTEVRSIMAGLAGLGKRTEAKALLQKFGVEKLSAIKPEDYPALVQEAQVIANG